MSRSALPLMRVKRKPAFNPIRAIALLGVVIGFACILPIAAAISPLAGIACFAFMLVNTLIIAGLD